MALRFIAIDPTTDDDGSPTIWEDENGDHGYEAFSGPFDSDAGRERGEAYKVR
ncbi:hypothetical protein ABIA31_006881 [Catenulispora sp. MAP5-51]